MRSEAHGAHRITETATSSTPPSRPYAISPEGTLKWSYATGHEVWASPVIGADGTVYVGSLNGNVYAVQSDGALKWSLVGVGSWRPSPAIGADGTVYIGSDLGAVFAGSVDGVVRGGFWTDGGVPSSPAMAPSGTIYISSTDSTVYALRSASPGLAASPWPKFRHDNRNTGNVSTPVP
jgi:outer membrane protein assembly factor BamB